MCSSSVHHCASYALGVGKGDTVEPLYSRHPWDYKKCLVQRGVLISAVDLYTFIAIWTQASVCYTKDVLISGVHSERFHCICMAT